MEKKLRGSILLMLIAMMFLLAAVVTWWWFEREIRMTNDKIEIMYK